ncbi:MAG: restriction endonuclease subunit S [Roseibacillus sp.]
MKTGRYQAYPEYQDSGIEWLGELPNHWITSTIKRLCLLHNGSTPKSDTTRFWDGDIPWVTPADLGKDSTPYITRGARSITKQGYESCGTSLVPQSSLILSSRAPIGTLGIASTNLCTNQGCKSLVVEKNTDFKFLFYFLLVSSEKLNVLGRGSTFLEISNEELGNFDSPKPPLPEQIQIAKFLDHETGKIDLLIEKQQELIALLKEKRQAVISHAVTKGLNPQAPLKDSGIEWLGQVPEHWSVKRIKNLCSIISKGTTPSTVGAEFIDSGVRFLKAENITTTGVSNTPEFFISQNSHKILSRGNLEENDVLVVIAGATTGKSAVLQRELLPSNTNQAVCYLRLFKKHFSHWMDLWLGTDVALNSISLNSVQAAQPNLSMEDLGNIPIAIPSNDELPEILAYLNEFTEKFDDSNAKAETQIALLQERRTALISAAVTGKIDVRNI